MNGSLNTALHVAPHTSQNALPNTVRRVMIGVML